MRKLVSLGILTELTKRTHGQIFMANEVVAIFGRDLSTQKGQTS